MREKIKKIPSKLRLPSLSFFFIFAALMGCESRSTIVYNVAERDANEIVSFLSCKGIAAAKIPATVSAVGATSKVTMWDISVPSEQVTVAIGLLNQAGLPRVKETTLLDLFGEKGLVPSDLENRIRYQEGLSDQLANTVRKMEGVLDADVQISWPPEGEENKEMAASVYVKHRGLLDSPNSPVIIKIKRFVASSVPGLKIENVTVVSDRMMYADLKCATETSEKIVTNELTSIWGIHIAPHSLFLFRFIFYIFLILLFCLFAALGWLLWKFYPLLENRGGFKALLEPKQFEEPAHVTASAVMPTLEENREMTYE